LEKQAVASNLPALFTDRFGEIGHYDPDSHIDGKMRLAVILIAILLVGGILAGALIPIGGAIIGAGQFGVESRVKKISHPGGGTVAQILVENGQQVKKGQILIRLDDKVSGTDAELSSLSVDQMLALKARLEAERLGTGGIAFPEALVQRKDATAQRAMADEQRMFAIRQTEEAGLAGQLSARIGQYEQQITGYDAQISALRKQGALIQPELQGVRQLYDKKLVTLNRLNQLERTAVDLGGTIGALTAQIAEARARIAETREQLIQIAQTRRSQAGDQLNQINVQLNQQQVRSVSAMDTQDRTLIRAPYDGVVEKLAVSTIGGVIRPGDVIMEIVPAQDRLLVEGAISPADIDQVHVGQPARIRLTALSSTSTPEVRGKVVYVAAERVTDPDGQRSYFPVRVAIDTESLAAQTSVKLKAGMPADVYVETGSRSMLSYVTKPLRDQFARAFRDN
jgi:HlyD family secretion protein